MLEFLCEHFSDPNKQQHEQQNVRVFVSAMFRLKGSDQSIKLPYRPWGTSLFTDAGNDWIRALLSTMNLLTARASLWFQWFGNLSGSLVLHFAWGGIDYYARLEWKGEGERSSGEIRFSWGSCWEQTSHVPASSRQTVCRSKVNATLKWTKSKSSIITPVPRTLNVKEKKSNRHQHSVLPSFSYVSFTPLLYLTLSVLSEADICLSPWVSGRTLSLFASIWCQEFVF